MRFCICFGEVFDFGDFDRGLGIGRIRMCCKGADSRHSYFRGQVAVTPGVPEPMVFMLSACALPSP